MNLERELGVFQTPLEAYSLELVLITWGIMRATWQFNQSMLWGHTLGFHSQQCLILQRTLGGVFRFPEPVSSSSVKEGDGPPSVVKVEGEGGSTCKTPVPDSCH